MGEFASRLQHAWSVFKGNEFDSNYIANIGPGDYVPHDRVILSGGNERSIVAAILNRIAIDVAAVTIYEAKVNENRQPTEKINSGLTECLTRQANIDQTGRGFIFDAVMSMFENGHVVLVPTDTSDDTNTPMTGAYDIIQMRVGKVTQWYPEYVEVEVYNEKEGRRRKVTVPKRTVAIIQNPFYNIMNTPNSTVSRLIKKLNYLDQIDRASSSGKMNLVLSLPYAVKTEKQRKEAAARVKQIEMQLVNNQYGITYVDGTEKITQLSHSLENNLLDQVKYLTTIVYDQFGLTEDVFHGKADEKEMLYYRSRCLEPILDSLVDEMNRKFITKTAAAKGHSIIYYINPFKLVPVDNVAEMADKFTRNEILTSNEFRAIIGFKPSEDPNADQLRNKNLNEAKENIVNKILTPMNDTAVDTNGASGATNQNGTKTGEKMDTKTFTSTLSEEEYTSIMANMDEIGNMLDSFEQEVNGKHIKHDAFENETVALVHYASPYYDPVYAHEYYMAHRKLKGKSTSSVDTTGLNEAGLKRAASEKAEAEASTEAETNALKYDVEQSLTSKQKELKKSMTDLSSTTKNNLSTMRKDYLDKIKAATTQEEKFALRKEMMSSITQARIAKNKVETTLKDTYRSETEELKKSSDKQAADIVIKYENQYASVVEQMKLMEKYTSTGTEEEKEKESKQQFTASGRVIS